MNDKIQLFFLQLIKEKSCKVEMVCSGALVQRDYTISEKTLDNLIKEITGEEKKFLLIEQ